MPRSPRSPKKAADASFYETRRLQSLNSTYEVASGVLGRMPVTCWEQNDGPLFGLGLTIEGGGCDREMLAVAAERIQLACLSDDTEELEAGLVAFFKREDDAQPEGGGAWRIVDRRGMEPLAMAAAHGNVGVIAPLVAAGAGVNSCSSICGRTALHRAATGGHVEVLTALLEKGATVGAATFEGATALHLAAGRGHAEACKVLIDGGAQVDVPDLGGLTPLMAACQGGHVDACSILLDAGAQHGAVDENGWTAAHFAAASSHKATALLLISKGAGLEVASKGARTVRHLNAALADELATSIAARDAEGEEGADGEGAELFKGMVQPHHGCENIKLIVADDAKLHGGMDGGKRS